MDKLILAVVFLLVFVAAYQAFAALVGG